MAIRLDGHALLSAIRYELHKLRGSAWGAILTASLSPAAGQDTYSPRARAVLVVSRYSLGLPWYRVQGDQAMVGVPVPEATPWDQIETGADCGSGVLVDLENVAAQGARIYQADTSGRMVSLFKENQQIRAEAFAQGLSRAKERTGMCPTALVVRVGERLLCVYYAGRAHAGAHLAALLEQRASALAPPVARSDAWSRTEGEAGLVMRCHCLAHGRRQCSDLAAVCPRACRVVSAARKQVFDPEEEARVQRMSPEARVAYHQTYSQPLRDNLQAWLDQQLGDRLVEPNSALGQAITYRPNHWTTLTRFVSIPGAPLENNVVERAWKLCMRQRNNSLFDKSAHSASIARVLTSLIVTCIYAGVNVLDELVALHEHRAEVFADPAAWWPWT